MVKNRAEAFFLECRVKKRLSGIRGNMQRQLQLFAGPLVPRARFFPFDCYEPKNPQVWHSLTR
jgi:hypothetical protein